MTRKEQNEFISRELIQRVEQKARRVGVNHGLDLVLQSAFEEFCD